MPKPLTDGIRAVVFLVADATVQHIAEEVTTAVKTHLQEQLESFNTNVEIMRDAVEHVTGTAKEITDKMNDFKDKFQETSKKLAQTSQDLVEKTQEAMTQDHITQNARPATYTTVTQQHILVAHLTVITRGETDDKQILIQKDTNAINNTLENLTEKDLVAKANTALDIMGIEAADRPKDTKFVGVKKL
jgi:TolA-binding protein